MRSPLTVELDEAALGALDQLAQSTGNPRDWLIARAIGSYVEQNAWQIE